MGTFITILIIIAAVLLVLLVLVQNSKGGGLASGFASGNQVMGAPKTADFLEKATWTLIGIIAFLSIIAVAFTKKQRPQHAEPAAQEEVVADQEAAPADEAGEATASFGDEAADNE